MGKTRWRLSTARPTAGVAAAALFKPAAPYAFTLALVVTVLAAVLILADTRMRWQRHRKALEGEQHGLQALDRLESPPPCHSWVKHPALSG